MPSMMLKRRLQRIDLGQPFSLRNEDCFRTFRRIPDASIDLVLADPPYGTTRCKWDSIIPLDRLWPELNRIAKPTTAVVIMAGQPFTSILICSNLLAFKYLWVWNKVNRIGGFLNAKKQPLRITEDITVFCNTSPIYYPIKIPGIPYKQFNGRKTENYNSFNRVETVNNGDRYQTNLLNIKAKGKGNTGLHPTQKPVALMEYLIQIYTNSGDLVLDFAMGSGTTGVAAGNLGRRFIGCDNDTEHGYFQTATERIEAAYNA